MVRYGEAVIFDLDGTLLDTVGDIAHSANSVLRKFGLPVHDPDAYRSFIGDGVVRLMKRALPKDCCDNDMVEKYVDAYFAVYNDHWNVKTALYEGVAEVLDTLAGLGVKMAVLSNKPDLLTKKCVNFFLGKWQFNPIWGQRPEVPRKPDPLAAQQIAGILKVPSSRILFVGDSEIDIKTAHAAGMIPVGALWGYGTPRCPEGLENLSLIHQPSEILEWVRAGT